MCKHCIQKDVGGSRICSSKTLEVNVHKEEIKLQDFYTMVYHVVAKKTEMALNVVTWKDRSPDIL